MLHTMPKEHKIIALPLPPSKSLQFTQMHSPEETKQPIRGNTNALLTGRDFHIYMHYKLFTCMRVYESQPDLTRAQLLGYNGAEPKFGVDFGRADTH